MNRGDYVYHRYIPQDDGRYERQLVYDSPPTPPFPTHPREAIRQETVPLPPQPPEPCSEPCGQPPAVRDVCSGKEREGGGHILSRLLPKGLDSGDLLVLVILLLLLIDGDEDDTLSVLLTVAAFILL